MWNLKIIAIAAAVFLVIIPAGAQSFFASSKTGGMSEIYLGDTRIKVDGGFIEWVDEDEVSVRAKAIEVSLNIDNSASKADTNLHLIVRNINPDSTKIIGWSEGEIKKGKNSIAFAVKVKAKKVTVYKLTPEIPEGGFKFIVFGESRGGKHVLKRIIGDIIYRKPLFAISLGDMVDEAADGSYRDFIDEISEVTVPFLTVAGSSELPGGSRRLYEDYFGSLYHSFNFRNNHFVVIDNGDDRMSEEQFVWLENDLIQNKAANTFVFMHTPPFDPRLGRKQPMNAGGQYHRLSGLLEKYKVTTVFAAGIHSYFREERGGIPYVITGGGGSELASADASYNYVIVDIEGDKASDKLIKLPPPSISLFARARLNARLYLKNSFEAYPVRTSIASVVIVLFLAYLLRVLLRRPFKRGKRKISL